MKPDLLHARGAFALEAFMRFLHIQGEGIDESYSNSFHYLNSDMYTSRHIFAPESYGQIEIGSCLRISEKSWIGKIAFSVKRTSDRQVDRDAFGLARSIDSNILFVSDGNTLRLGGFFNRKSDLRTSLNGFLCGIDEMDLPTSEVGKGLLQVIQYHGLPSLIKVWDDLCEAELFPILLQEDPFGYPELDPVNPIA